MDRHTIADVAETLGVSSRTVNRRLVQIREIWQSSGLVDEHESRRLRHR